MCRTCGAPIQTEIVATRGIEPLMPEELFDMSNRTAVKEEGRGHGVPHYMRAHRLRQAGPTAIERERVFDPIPLLEAAWGISLLHEERFVVNR